MVGCGIEFAREKGAFLCELWKCPVKGYWSDVIGCSYKCGDTFISLNERLQFRWRETWKTYCRECAVRHGLIW